MTFTAYIITKNGTYWSRSKAKFVSSPAEAGTFADKAEAEALAATSEVPEEKSYQERHPRTGRMMTIGRDIEYCPPADVLEVKIEVPNAT
jgi:hypothetical protein